MRLGDTHSTRTEKLSSQERRQSMLDAGLRLIVTEGLGQFNFDKVVEYSGVSKSTPVSPFS